MGRPITRRGKQEKPMGENTRLNIYLTRDLHKSLMHRSIDEGRSASEIVVALVEDYLAKSVKKGGK